MSILNFSSVLWNFLDKRGMPECILFALLIHFKDRIGFLGIFLLWSLFIKVLLLSSGFILFWFFFFFRVFLQG